MRRGNPENNSPCDWECMPGIPAGSPLPGPAADTVRGMADLAPRRNDELARILSRLGWGPERLAAEVNAMVGSQMAINKTTPYHWRDRGRVPRPPYDQV